MQYIEAALTTDASGDASVTVQVNPGNNFIRKIEYVKTDYADTVDISIVDATGTVLLGLTNQTVSGEWCPTQPTHSTTGVARLYAAGGLSVAELIPVVGSLAVTVDEGGNAKTGVIRIWVA